MIVGLMSCEPALLESQEKCDRCTQRINAALSEQEVLYIEFIMALDYQFLPDITFHVNATC